MTVLVSPMRPADVEGTTFLIPEVGLYELLPVIEFDAVPRAGDCLWDGETTRAVTLVVWRPGAPPMVLLA